MREQPADAPLGPLFGKLAVGGDNQERGDNPGGGRQKACANVPRFPAAMTNNAEDLDRQNRQHAGHQVEDQATQNGQRDQIEK